MVPVSQGAAVAQPELRCKRTGRERAGQWSQSQLLRGTILVSRCAKCGRMTERLTNLQKKAYRYRAQNWQSLCFPRGDALHTDGQKLHRGWESPAPVCCCRPPCCRLPRRSRPPRPPFPSPRAWCWQVEVHRGGTAYELGPFNSALQADLACKILAGGCHGELPAPNACLPACVAARCRRERHMAAKCPS